MPCFDRKPFCGRKMQGGGKGKGKGGNPAVLTSKIKEAETAGEVLRLLDGAVDDPIFNEFHAAAACTSWRPSTRTGSCTPLTPRVR